MQRKDTFVDSLRKNLSILIPLITVFGTGIAFFGESWLQAQLKKHENQELILRDERVQATLERAWLNSKYVTSEAFKLQNKEFEQSIKNISDEMRGIREDSIRKGVLLEQILRNLQEISVYHKNGRTNE